MHEPEAPDRRALFAGHLLRNRGRLFAYVHALVRNLADADDVFQQTALALRRRFDTYDPARSFLNWALGVAWEADTGDGHAALKYSGSRVWALEGDTKKDVYQSERWSNNGLGYVFDVEPGRYEVVLLFAETNATFAAKGKRLFDIEINTKKAAEKVDVFTEAGGASKPWQFRKVVEVTGKELEIKLLANPTGPAIKGIELRGLPAKGASSNRHIRATTAVRSNVTSAPALTPSNGSTHENVSPYPGLGSRARRAGDRTVPGVETLGVGVRPHHARRRGPAGVRVS